MSRSFYSEFVNHCLRFYARHPKPDFRSEVDKANWFACDRALKGFTDSEREILIYIYKEGETIPDNVYQIAKDKNIHQDSIWKLVNGLERKVAKKRGLL